MAHSAAAGSPDNFYVAGGTLRPDAPSYVERQADQELLHAILQGEFCYALTSRQMGKSSLMVRTVKTLRTQGAAVAVLDLTSVGQNLSAEQWYDGLMARLGHQLNLEDELLEFWRSNERWGPLQRWTTALEKLVLPRCPGNVVVFVDELDVVRSLPFSTDEFFAAIRECYNRRSTDPAFNRLTFCLLGVATPTDLIRDTRLTPFNIGRRIELNDFTNFEASSLARGIHANPQIASRLLQRVLYWTGGHPYLTQRLCRAIAQDPQAASPADVDRHCEELFLSSRARQRDDNLIFVRERVLQSEGDRAALLDLYRRVRNGARPADDQANPLVSVLRLAGLARGVNGRLENRNRIYARVFDTAWITANLPAAELRRQRAAFRRGLAGATLTLATLGALLFIPSPFSKPPQSRLLPDGSTLTLNKIYYGKKLHFEPRAARLGWLAEKIPPLRRFFFRGSLTISSQDDAFLFGIVLRNAPTTSSYNLGALVFDQTALEFPAGGRSYSSASSAEIVHAWHFTSFPRRHKSFGLRIYDQPSGSALIRTLAEFTIELPNLKPHPNWIAESLPVSRKVDDLEFNLVEFTTGLSHPDFLRKAVTNELPWTLLRFGVLHNGKPTLDWRPESVDVVDATGNGFRAELLNQTESGLIGAFPAGLSLAETAYRLGVIFKYRGAPERNAWKISGILVPALGQTFFVDHRFNAHGVTARLHRLSLADHSQPAVSENSPPRCGIEVQVAPLTKGTVLELTRVTDQDGVELRAPIASGQNFDDHCNYGFGVELQTNSKSLNLEFTIDTRRSAEFTARPSRLSGTEPQARSWVPDPQHSTQTGKDWSVTLVKVSTGTRLQLVEDHSTRSNQWMTVVACRSTNQLTRAAPWAVAGPITLIGHAGYADLHVDLPGGTSSFKALAHPPDLAVFDQQIHLPRGYFGTRLSTLRLSLRRTAAATFDPDETWVIPNVPIPKAGEFIVGRTNAVLQAARLEWLGIAGPNAVLPGIKDAKPQPFTSVYFRCLLPTEKEFHALDPMDDQGRIVRVRSRQGVSSAAGSNFLNGSPRLWLFVCTLDLPPSSATQQVPPSEPPASLTLRVAIDGKPQTVEFRMNPI